MRALQAFIRDQSGGPAAEFALVLPLALLFIFGIIDVGRFMWEYNRAEKATQMGTRYAVVTNVVDTGLTNYSFAVSCGIPQGDPIPSSAFSGVTCTGGGTVATPTVSCSTNSGSCSVPSTPNATNLKGIVDRMRAFKSDITPSNVTVDYRYSGLGYSGDPNGMDIAPLVTVNVSNLIFRPITTMLFNATVNMPTFSYTLTMEDGSGTVSN